MRFVYSGDRDYLRVMSVSCEKNEFYNSKTNFLELLALYPFKATNKGYINYKVVSKNLLREIIETKFNFSGSDPGYFFDRFDALFKNKTVKRSEFGDFIRIINTECKNNSIGVAHFMCCKYDCGFLHPDHKVKYKKDTVYVSGSVSCQSVFVNENYRKQGIAKQMYLGIEKHFNVEIIPTKVLSIESKFLHKSLNKL